MRKILAVVLLFISLPSLSSDLKKVDDVVLSHILATQEVVFKSKTLPNIILIQSWDQVSECGGNYESCPNARLFIVVATGDLYETPLLYELPPAKGWELVHNSESEYETTVVVKTTLYHANITEESRLKWASKQYKIVVSKCNGEVTLSM